MAVAVAVAVTVAVAVAVTVANTAAGAVGEDEGVVGAPRRASLPRCPSRSSQCRQVWQPAMYSQRSTRYWRQPGAPKL